MGPGQAAPVGVFDRPWPNRLVGVRRTSALAFVSLGHGPGHQIQSPMGQVILGGLVSSTVLNLVLVPVLFLRWGGTPAGRPDEAA